jgi:hypothetical protein
MEVQVPTFMTRDTFTKLVNIRNALGAGPLAGSGGRPAGIFVPWAGARLRDKGGVYYVGMATDSDYWADDPPDFDLRLDRTQSICTDPNANPGTTPFWQFLDGLTWALLGAPFRNCWDRWGWSNLLKIGWSVGSPDEWHPKLLDEQRDICVTALREELEPLHNSLIVAVSANPFGVLDSSRLFPRLVPNWQAKYDDNWDRSHEETGCWSFTDPNSGNLYIHCYHPNYPLNAGEWGSALGYIIHLARRMPRFRRAARLTRVR